MDEDGNDFFFVVQVQVNLAAREAFHHRVHGFEVRRVGAEGQVDFRARIGFDGFGVAQVVLYVAVEDAFVVVLLAFKLAEDLAVRLAEDVRQRVEASAVGHAQDHFFHPAFHAFFDDGINGRDDCLAAFHAEALLAHEFLLEELLKDRRLVHLAQNMLALLGAELRAILDLDVLVDPVHPFGVADVHEFDADALAVGLGQVIDDFLEGGGTDAHFFACLEDSTQVAGFQPKVLDVEGGGVLATLTYRVGFGEQVTTGTVSVDQLQHTEFLVHVLRDSVTRGVVCFGEFKALEEQIPGRVHRIGVFAVLLVQLLDGAGVSIAEE